MVGFLAVSAGSAYAQTPEERAAVRAETPWYERYTTNRSSELATSGLGPSDRRDTSWRVNGRWAVTVDVNEARRVERFAPGGDRDDAAFGAYFQLSPNMRVGGQVSVGRTPAAAVTPLDRDEERAADVRVQSAFRF